MSLKKPKKGDVFYKYKIEDINPKCPATTHCTNCDNCFKILRIKVSFYQVHVTCIRKARNGRPSYMCNPVNVILREKVKGVSWVKKSKKNFDYGWSDDDIYKQRYELYEDTGISYVKGLSSSKAGAMLKAINNLKSIVKKRTFWSMSGTPEQDLNKYKSALNNLIKQYDKEKGKK